MPDNTAPTADELCARFPERTRRMLHVDTRAPEALDRALVWVESRFLRHGRDVTWTRTTREATLKRAEYEVWAMAEVEDTARDKKDDANDLLEAVFGSGFDAGAGDAGANAPFVPSAAVRQSERSPLSTRFANA